jgi:signal recognition particle subunit SEC65
MISSVPVKAYLLHLTHYSPGWYLRKRREKAIDLPLALEIIDAVYKAGFNMLIIDCEDGLIYDSHPELARRYSVRKPALKKLLDLARRRKLELVPKLNFSQSRYHRHSYWLKPYYAVFDTDKYWKVAYDLIDELVGEFRPRRFFHIGMDEDDTRSDTQYIKAVLALRRRLAEWTLRPVMWNDTALGKRRPWHTGKSLAAEKALPKDIVQAVWDYKRCRPEIVRRIAREGFEVWAAPGTKPSHVLQWKKAMLEYGGRGLVMTTWLPCRPRNRAKLLGLINRIGPLYF